MKKRLLTAAFLIGCSFTLNAQQVTEQETTQKKYNTYKTTWEKNRFKDTWFISFGSGAQLLMGEDDDKGDQLKAVTYAPSFTIGKYFSPIWGLRLNLTGGSLHGYNDGQAGTYRKWNKGSKNYLGEGYAKPENYPNYPKEQGTNMLTWDPQWNYMGWYLDGGGIAQNGKGEYYWSKNSGDGKLYMQHVHYLATNLDFMFDFLTLIGNYDPKRSFEITPFAGLTYFHVFPHKGQIAYDGFGANAGLQFKFRMNDKWNIFAEGTLSMYPDDFDGHAGDNVVTDLVAQVVGGVTYKIGKSTWNVCEPVDYGLIDDLNRTINDLRNKECPECPECPPVPQPQPQEEEKPQTTKFLPDPVFFRIDKSVIDKSEWVKIEKAANYLQAHPDVKVIVTGYADKKTAYPAYNMKLSERRSKNVAKSLISTYGVSPSRVSVDWSGDKVQPYEVNEWNRVVIFVLDK
ncbi:MULTISPECIES: OmpA family protein [unclassified Dysgonomonas]|uniref:OmpA family protein n=1 Tax=unclassified Dysgonomonas TaxID=2630389 RepID=UPI002472F182|nr:MULTISPECIES: OmpA family protein [unclassified Dysgonomonas]